MPPCLENKDEAKIFCGIKCAGQNISHTRGTVKTSITETAIPYLAASSRDRFRWQSR
jgi:hypothetical protein